MAVAVDVAKAPKDCARMYRALSGSSLAKDLSGNAL